MRVFVIDNGSGGMPHDNRWETVTEEIGTYENVSKVYWIKGHRNLDYTFTKFHSTAVLSRDIIQYLRNYVKKGSVIIFPNARDPLVIQLREYSDVFGLDLKLIGFWNDGSYYQFGNIRTHLRGKKYDWSTSYERVLVKCLDYNLVTLKSNLNRFKKMFVNDYQDQILYCPLPFSLVIDRICQEIKQLTIEKDDSILMNVIPNSVSETQLFNAMQSQFPEFTFINLSKIDLTPIEYRRIVSRAKILFSVNRSDTDPYYILESMLYGCAPILPNIPIYSEMFDAKHLYPLKILKPPYLNFIRGFENFEEKIWNIQKNFVLLDLEQETETIIERHFNSKIFKEIINSI